MSCIHTTHNPDSDCRYKTPWNTLGTFQAINGRRVKTIGGLHYPVDADGVVSEVALPERLWRVVDTWRGGDKTLPPKVRFTARSFGAAGHNECFAWIHKNTPFSFHEATKNQGYKIEEADVQAIYFEAQTGLVREAPASVSNYYQHKLLADDRAWLEAAVEKAKVGSGGLEYETGFLQELARRDRS